MGYEICSFMDSLMEVNEDGQHGKGWKVIMFDERKCPFWGVFVLG